MTMKTITTSLAVALAVTPAAAAQAREPVTRAEAAAAAHRVAHDAALGIAAQSGTGVEALSDGAARVDRARASATTCATGSSAWARLTPSSEPTR